MTTARIEEKRLRQLMNDYVDNKVVVAVQPKNMKGGIDYNIIGTLREFVIGWFSVEHEDTMTHLNFKMSEVAEVCDHHSKPIILLNK